MIRKLFFFIILTIFIACSKSAVIEDPMMATKTSISSSKQLTGEIPVDERLVSGVLENGMKYYIQKNSKPENRAELRLAVNAGSILEDDDQRGLAHFVEHMAFNGTTNFKKSELVDYLESVGTRFGPDLNAYTSFDETVYMLQVRTDSTELFDKGMLILKDWASGVSFEHREIDKERGVVESEWRTSLSANERMQKITLPIQYKGSRYAERLPIGDPETIKNADYSVVKRYYNDWYRPDLMAVVVVGDVNPEEVEDQIKASFGQIPAPISPRERKEYDVPSHPETLIAIASDEEATFTMVNITNKLPKTETKTMEEMRSSILRSAYNGMLNERLSEIGNEPDPPFVYAYTGYSGDLGDIDSYSSFAMVPEGKSLDALERLLVENKRVLKYGFTESELERQKVRMLEQAERSFKEMDKTDSRQLAMRYVYNYLDDIPLPSPAQMLKILNKYLPGIMVEEINALPQQWISDGNRVITITGPDKKAAPIPAESDVREILAKVQAMSLENYVDDVVEGPLLDKELVPVNISNEMTDAKTGITSFELANGVKVYLKPTTFKNDEIIMSANSEGGSSLYPDSTYFDAAQAAGIVNTSGIGKFNNTQLDKLMSGKTAYVSPYIGFYYEGMNGGASPKDVEEMFKLVYLYFTDIRKDEDAFNSYINKQKGIYKNLQSNPSYYFSDYGSRLKYRNHARVGFPNIYQFNAIKLDRALGFYKERFADASDFAFSFVGNFDLETMKAYTQKYLGNLPSIKREETWKDIELEIFPGQLRKSFKNGTAPKTQVEMFFHGDFEYTPDNVYKFNSMLDYLRIKLREELREDKGGVYGVGLSGGASRIPKENYSITISFNTDPDRTQELITAAKEVIKKAQMQEPSDQDMTKVKETQKQSKIKNLEENRYWSNQIMSIHNNDQIDFNSILLESLEDKINNLTPSDIKNSAGKFFNFKNYIELVMEPEDKPQN